MKKLIAGLLAVGMLAGGSLSAAATDYMSQIKLEIQYGFVDEIEVGTTLNQLYTYLKSKGYSPGFTGDSRNVYTGYEIYMWTGKQSTFTCIVNGDVNKDGKVNEADRDQILKYIAGATPADSFVQAAADINNDYKINITDVLEINDIINRHAND